MISVNDNRLIRYFDRQTRYLKILPCIFNYALLSVELKFSKQLYCRHGVICLQREPASHLLNILFVRSYAILYIYTCVS